MLAQKFSDFNPWALGAVPLGIWDTVYHGG
jgi:hypothetical protein